MNARTDNFLGMYACAAAKAALVMYLTRRHIDKVSITLPEIENSEFVIHDCLLENGVARCSVLVNGNDDVNAGNELIINAEVSIKRKKGVTVEAGKGIAGMTGSCLAKHAGRSTIDRATLVAIRQELSNVLDDFECHRGAQVVLSVHGGEKVDCRDTLSCSRDNRQMPIVISFGKLKPWSHPAIKENLVEILDAASRNGFHIVAMVQDGIGEHAVHRRYILGTTQVVNINNYVGFMVRQAAVRFKKVLVVGHPGKLLKILLDCYNTQTQKSASALPYLKREAEKEFWCGPTVQATLMVAPTAEGVIACIPLEERQKFFKPIATRIEAKLKMYARSPVDVGVVLVDTDCHCLGLGDRARSWEVDGWLQLR